MLERKAVYGIMLALLLTVVIPFSVVLPAEAQSTSVEVINPAVNNGDFVFYTSTTRVGDRFNATIWIGDAVNLFAFQIYLTVNDTLLDISRAWIPDWDMRYVFFGRPTLPKTPPILVDNDGDGSHEAVLIGDGLLASPGVTFTGRRLAAIVEFEILYEPTVQDPIVWDYLNINNPDTFLLDDSLSEISALKVNGYYEYEDNGTSDSTFETFGPRADKLLIKLYSNETAEWDALTRGEIDITDWELSKAYYDLFTSNTINPATGLPYNGTINTISYGPQYNLHLLDINNNNNQFLGNPPNPAYVNPVYPNPCSVKQFRQAIAHLADRSQLDTIIGKGFYTPLYTIVPPSMGTYAHPDIKPGGTLESLTYPYSRVAAEALLDLNGFSINVSTGWRYWDRNSNGVEDADEYLELKFYIRYDKADRLAFGNFLADELNAVKVRVKRIYNIVSPIYLDQVYGEKNFHLYTGAWNLGPDPDHLTLWNWDYYWHPGSPYNYDGINNPDFNTYSYAVEHAVTLEDAKTMALLAQEVFASEALSIPLWSNAGSKAISRIYTGGNKWTSVLPDDGENMYRSQHWEGTVNKPGEGIDNFHSFLNMHPQGFERGDGENMTIRWGFKTKDIMSFNPLSAEWQSDWSVLHQIYESLLTRNPSDPSEFISCLVENFEVGTYIHPLYGNCSKVKFTMRSEATWHDGTPITVADIYFTWVEIWRTLDRRGMPWPTWATWHGRDSWTTPMVDLKIYDAYNFEILFDFHSALRALEWLSGEIILPKHIWKPIVDTASFDVIQGPAPDPNMIGSGPWRFKEYVASDHILLVANRPSSTVKTSHAGSTNVTSPKGYWHYLPLNLEWKIDGSTLSKVKYGASHTVNFTLSNLYYTSSIVIDVHRKVTFANGTVTESSQTDVTLGKAEQPGADWTWSFSSTMKHKIRFDVNMLVKSPSTLSGWINVTKCLWTTLASEIPWIHLGEDIVGSTLYDDIGFISYPYKGQLPTPDFKVDVKDVSVVAKAFGSYPGHPRWDPFVDINNDYKIDIKDIAAICKRFGWTSTP